MMGNVDEEGEKDVGGGRKKKSKSVTSTTV